MKKQILDIGATILLIVALTLGGGIYLHQRALDARLAGALDRDDVKSVEATIRQGASVKTRGSHGETPLMVAAAHGSPEFVRLIIERGAEVDAVSDSGCTAVIAAAIMGNEATTRVLIEAGADVNKRQYQHSPLSVSRERGHEDVMRLLKAAGAR